MVTVTNIESIDAGQEWGEWTSARAFFGAEAYPEDSCTSSGLASRAVAPAGRYCNPASHRRIPLATDQELFLFHVAIVTLRFARAEANKEGVARFIVELYVEEMRSNYSVKDA